MQGGARDPDRPRLPWGRAALGAILLAALASGREALARPGAVMQGLDDAALLVPIALRQAHPDLFVGDVWLATTSPVFSASYSALLAPLVDATGDPVTALRALSSVALAALLLGTWLLVARFAGTAAGGVAAALVAALPGNPQWVWTAGSGLPRDLVFAATPWLLLGLDRTRRGGLRGTVLLFVLLGLLTNLHPLTGLHAACLLIAAGAVAEPALRTPARLAAAGGAFLAGAAPYVVRYVTLPRPEGTVDPVVYAWDLRGIAGETPLEWASRMEGALWLGAAAAVVALAARRAGGAVPRALVAWTVVALVVAAVAGVVVRWVEPLRPLQFARFHRFASFGAIAVGAVAGAEALRRGRRLAPAAAAGIVALGVAGPHLVAAATGGVARGPMAHAARAVERAAGVPYERARPGDLPRRAAPPDVNDPAVRAHFLAVCDHARTATATSDLFLVPPEGWAPFRAYARRGVAVSRKEAGASLSFLGARGMDWYRDYVEAVACYAGGDERAWRDLARKWDARFAVVDPAAQAPPWREVFASGPYRVLAVPRGD